MTTQQNKKVLHIILWVVQGLLAMTLLWGAFSKLFQPLEQLAEMLPWATDNPGLVLFTGIVDLLGGIGLIVPALLRIQPKLTVFAALGTIALMLAAAAFHFSRGEGDLTPINIIIALVAAFVAWGRSKKAPIAS